MRILKILGGFIGLFVLLIGSVFLFARFHDGPLAVIPGGPLASGEWVTKPVSDWTFAASTDLIEMQLADDATSRTTWILVEGGQAYIPCSLGFPPGKDWHLRAKEDGRAIVRVLGKRYRVTLARIDDPPLEDRLKAIVGEKYGGGPPSDAGVWFFALNPS